MAGRHFRRHMRQAIGRHYNLGELKNAVFDLNLDWDELEGPLKSNKISALVARMERDGRLPELLALLRREHPGVDWPSIPAGPPEDAPDRPDLRQIRAGATTDLSGAILKGAVLNGVHLADVNLRDADCRRASFYLADLTGADLRGADLRGAKLRKAILVRANLTGARLARTDFRLANLRDAIVTPAQMAEIRKLKGATLPNGRLYDPDSPLSAQL